jgi:hypothetical protein
MRRDLPVEKHHAESSHYFALFLVNKEHQVDLNLSNLKLEEV